MVFSTLWGSIPLPIYVLAFAEYLMPFCFVAGCHCHSVAPPWEDTSYLHQKCYGKQGLCFASVWCLLHHPSSHSKPNSLASHLCASPAFIMKGRNPLLVLAFILVHTFFLVRSPTLLNISWLLSRWNVINYAARIVLFTTRSTLVQY